MYSHNVLSCACTLGVIPASMFLCLYWQHSTTLFTSAELIIIFLNQLSCFLGFAQLSFVSFLYLFYLNQVLLSFMLCNSSRKHGEKPMRASDARYCGTEENLVATPDSCSWANSELAYSSENQNLGTVQGESRRR